MNFMHGKNSALKEIKTCVKYCTNDISFIRLHEIYKRATPNNYSLYKHALSTYKLMNSSAPYSTEWVALNFNQTLTSRQVNFRSNKANKKRVGLNALANRIACINDKIPLTWFNYSLDSFKIICKLKFLM